MRKRLLQAAVVTLTVVLCLGALELFSRLIHGGKAPLLPYYFEGGAALLPPGRDINASFYGLPANRYVTDAWGARIADPADANESARDGVIVVGDSQMLGYMLDFEQTFASRLGAELAGSPRATRIIAAPASQPESYVVALHRYAQRSKPARQKLAVVGLNLGNDLDELYGDGIARPQDTGALRRWLLTNSYVFMDFVLLQSHRLDPGDTPVGVNPVSYMLNSQERVVLARETARVLDDLLRDPALDAERKILVIVPADIQVDAAQFRKYRRYYNSDEEFESWNAQAPAMAAMMNTLEDYIARLMEQRGQRVVRFSKLIPPGTDASRLFNQDNHHLTAEANSILAEAVLRAAREGE